jgi:uncharacterized protein YndB with AHSA1/START domain
MNTPQISDRSSDAVFRTERTLPYTPTQVFEAFAQPEKLARWWGPSGFTNTFELFEFKPGGRWKFVMHGPNGANYDNENIFEKLDRPSTVVIRHVSAPQFVLAVTLEERQGQTHLRWVQEFADASVAASVRHIVEPANEQNIDRLTSLLAAG